MRVVLQMDSKSKRNTAALLVADLAVLNGVVMGFIYLSSKQWSEAMVVGALAIAGIIYLVRNGVFWPGQSIARYWRRYVF